MDAWAFLLGVAAGVVGVHVAWTVLLALLIYGGDGEGEAPRSGLRRWEVPDR